MVMHCHGLVMDWSLHSLTDVRNIKSIDFRNGFEDQYWAVDESLPEGWKVKLSMVVDDSLPEGWKVKLSMVGDKLCESFLTPTNKRLASRHTAIDHLISTGGTEEQVALMRRGLKKFGWEEEVNLPSGWLRKATSFLSPCNKMMHTLPDLLDFLLTQKADFQVTDG